VRTSSLERNCSVCLSDYYRGAGTCVLVLIRGFLGRSTDRPFHAFQGSGGALTTFGAVDVSDTTFTGNTALVSDAVSYDEGTLEA
jgi:hypothetical protein